MAKKVKTTKKKATRSSSSRSAPARNLVIVESPAKAKTINKYLGRDYVVKASMGHVRDLPPHQYGIDPGQNFKPSYEIVPSRRKLVSELHRLADRAETVYLATDLDREGEAIAWHLVHALNLTPNKVKRVVFNEITKSAIIEAFSRPHDIEIGKVDAQQARRILDRIVGYELSPLLWKKIAKGLSAGRVQSVAVRLIVDREMAIRAFQPPEYWTIDGVFAPADQDIEALSTEWAAYIAGTGKGDPPTLKQRRSWQAKRSCFEASLSQVVGKTFKPEGTLDTSKPVEEMFTSAVENVRPIAGALGYSVSDVSSREWGDYAHLGLKQVELQGKTTPSTAPAFTIKSVDTKRTKSKPSAPFTTASLQQAAANQLHMSASVIMRTAQALYEGVDFKTGEGSIGLITYMRTDSRNLSSESIQAARSWIGDGLGEDYLPAKPNYYSSSAKAQEAHEAIRPTDVTRTPESLKGHLTAQQHKLYKLIWQRFVACQMTPAQWDATTVLIAAETEVGEAVFKASGRVLVFDGFYKVTGVPAGGENQMLPAMEVGQRVAPVEIRPQQKFTQGPPRFTEASLVKTLESEGIGRPSTYAAIIQTIQDRGYVEQMDRRFHTTPRGEMVTEKLVAHFPKVMDIRFTSHVEDELDKIEEKHCDWHEVLHEFYDPFKVSLAKANDEMERVRAEASEYVCEECGEPMVYRLGKNGRFLSCSAYPKCRVAHNVDKDGKIVAPVKSSEPCELCGKDMILRRSRMGPFLGCAGYPECANTKPCTDDGTALRKVEAADLKVSCPECDGPMEVKFARGRSFMGCGKYPKCKATAPLPEGVYVEKPKPEDAGARCDKCGRKIVIRKSRRGPFLSCSGFPKCRNAMPMDKLDHLKELEAEGKIPDPPPEPVKGAKKTPGKRPKNLTKEEIAALGPPPAGFAWTRTGRPVVEVLPDKPLTCFECGDDMTLRNGRFGPFFACHSNKCKAAANLRGKAKKQAEADAPEAQAKPIETDVACPDCGKKMLLRMGRTGRFLGCSGYPECKKTMEPPPGLLREVAAASA